MSNASISIHAPLAGSDVDTVDEFNATVNISIHAPLAGSDHIKYSTTDESKQFLSTLPARGATGTFSKISHDDYYFYPRSPRGERLDAIKMWEHEALFLSTLPSRGATRCIDVAY